MSEEQQTPVVLDIRKLYAGDMSVEVPHAPEIFQQELNPEISLGVAYLVEVAQSGIFEISGLPDAQLHHALNVYCPTVLYPYAREGISNAINRAGFPNLYLQPINFDLMYQQRLQEAAQQADQPVQ